MGNRALRFPGESPFVLWHLESRGISVSSRTIDSSDSSTASGTKSTLVLPPPSNLRSGLGSSSGSLSRPPSHDRDFLLSRITLPDWSGPGEDSFPDPPEVGPPPPTSGTKGTLSLSIAIDGILPNDAFFLEYQKFDYLRIDDSITRTDFIARSSAAIIRDCLVKNSSAYTG